MKLDESKIILPVVVEKKSEKSVSGKKLPSMEDWVKKDLK
jgi:hypothetical protein